VLKTGGLGGSDKGKKGTEGLQVFQRLGVTKNIWLWTEKKILGGVGKELSRLIPSHFGRGRDKKGKKSIKGLATIRQNYIKVSCGTEKEAKQHFRKHRTKITQERISLHLPVDRRTIGVERKKKQKNHHQLGRDGGMFGGLK